MLAWLQRVVPTEGLGRARAKRKVGVTRSQPQRILLVGFTPRNNWTGMGKWAAQMERALRELGHQPDTWHSNDFALLASTGRLAVLLFPPALALRLLRRAGEFDVVVIHEPSGLWYGLLARFVRALPPMVAMCHNVESKHLRELIAADAQGLASVPRGTRVKSPILRNTQSDATIRLAEQVVCLSKLDADYIEQVLGRESRRITVQVNGAPSISASRRANRLPRKVVFVGGWLDTKGRRVLPQIWEQIVASVPDATLTLIGTGTSEEEVLGNFSSVGRDRVTVIPRVTDEGEVHRIMAEHDIFLMPSLSEGSPLALLEAMAVGLPVVATRVGGIPDIVSEPEYGLLFDPFRASDGAAAVLRLMGDPELAGALGAASQRRASVLTWSSAARSLLQATTAAIEGRGHASPNGK